MYCCRTNREQWDELLLKARCQLTMTTSISLHSFVFSSLCQMTMTVHSFLGSYEQIIITMLTCPLYLPASCSMIQLVPPSAVKRPNPTAADANPTDQLNHATTPQLWNGWTSTSLLWWHNGWNCTSLLWWLNGWSGTWRSDSTCSIEVCERMVGTIQKCLIKIRPLHWLKLKHDAVGGHTPTEGHC